MRVRLLFLPGLGLGLGLGVRVRVRLSFLPSASTSEVISWSEISYWHFQLVIEPFLIASSGRPAPTCHSCIPFLPTLIPACRASCTSSHLYACMHVCILHELPPVCMHACMYASCTSAYACMHACILHERICMHACMYASCTSSHQVLSIVIDEIRIDLGISETKAPPLTVKSAMSTSLAVPSLTWVLTSTRMHACMMHWGKASTTTCMYICMHACMHVCTRACMYACMYICMHACTHDALG